MMKEMAAKAAMQARAMPTLAPVERGFLDEEVLSMEVPGWVVGEAEGREKVDVEVSGVGVDEGLEEGAGSWEVMSVLVIGGGVNVGSVEGCRVDVGGTDVCGLLVTSCQKEAECTYNSSVRPKDCRASYRADDHGVRRYLNSLDISDCHDEAGLCSSTYRSGHEDRSVAIGVGCGGCKDCVAIGYAGGL